MENLFFNICICALMAINIAIYFAHKSTIKNNQKIIDDLEEQIDALELELSCIQVEKDRK